VRLKSNMFFIIFVQRRDIEKNNNVLNIWYVTGLICFLILLYTFRGGHKVVPAVPYNLQEGWTQVRYFKTWLSWKKLLFCKNLSWFDPVKKYLKISQLWKIIFFLLLSEKIYHLIVHFYANLSNLFVLNSLLSW